MVKNHRIKLKNAKHHPGGNTKLSYIMNCRRLAPKQVQKRSLHKNRMQAYQRYHTVSITEHQGIL